MIRIRIRIRIVILRQIDGVDSWRKQVIDEEAIDAIKCNRGTRAMETFFLIFIIHHRQSTIDNRRLIIDKYYSITLVCGLYEI